MRTGTMAGLAALLAPAVLAGGEPRYARLGEFDGNVEVQLDAAGPWVAGSRNLPLPESAWIRTAAGARAEIEFDEGTVARLGPDSLLEISDDSRLSTGQRITLLSLDHGLAYLTGAAESSDTLVFAVPGAQVSLRQHASVRLAAPDTASQIAVMSGRARFSSPDVELDLKAGQMIRVEPSAGGRFFLYNDVPQYDTDRWSDDRDRALAATGSAGQVPGTRYGLADLDAHGAWIQTAEFGAVWKPGAQDGWAPFRNGKWKWYDGLGYTWISGDTWGWLPYHYGRWMRMAPVGWFWVPGKEARFSPGEVYWVHGKDFAGWGPLAPGEQWASKTTPQLYLRANTTFARFQPGAAEIDPAAAPVQVKEPLAAAVFTAALPSPPLPAERLRATRPPLRAGSTRVVPVLPGVTYQPDGGAVAAAAAAQSEPAPAAVEPIAIQETAPQPPVVVITQPAPQPEEVYYPVPVYTGIVVVNPPSGGDHRHHPRPPAPAPGPDQKPPQPKPAAQPPVPRGGTQAEGARRPAPPRVPPASSPTPPGTAAPPAPATIKTPAAPASSPQPGTASPPAAKPVPRGDSSAKDGDRPAPRRE